MRSARIATNGPAPAPARAYFEETAIGARGIALGSSAVGVVTDASAYHWNPAALGQMVRPEVLVDYAKPYGVPDLNVGTLVLAAPRSTTSGRPVIFIMS